MGVSRASGSSVFQSLSGFQVRCNIFLCLISAQILICFNPYRVFKFVATTSDPILQKNGHWSFNPYRVFKFVATSRFLRDSLAALRFQSLSGFQVRCNGNESKKLVELEKFQSLSGFQVRCNLKKQPIRVDEDGVSIPIGFSSSLQQKLKRSAIAL